MPNELAGKRLELRLDRPNGALIGTMTVTGTGSWSTYQQQSINRSAATGVHDLYMVARDGWGVANVDWFIFQ